MRLTTGRLLIAVCLAGVSLQAQQVVLQDNFSGNSLDTSLWKTNGGHIISLQNELSSTVNVGPGGAQLAVSTYDPDANAGTDLLGTQFESLEPFQPGDGSTVSFSTQLQLQSVQPGIVYGMYFYDCGATCYQDTDEIDIELLTNDLQSGSPMQAELNYFVNGAPDTGYGGLATLPTGFDPLAVHDWTISWSASQILYYVDGTLLGSVTASADITIPESQLHVNEIAFAPSTNWPAANSGTLVPTSSPGSTYDALITDITVTESPEPSTLILLLPAVAVLYWRRKNGIRIQQS